MDFPLSLLIVPANPNLYLPLNKIFSRKNSQLYFWYFNHIIKIFHACFAQKELPGPLEMIFINDYKLYYDMDTEIG